MDLNVNALLFDKDGTLFDFESSWGPWFAGFFAKVAKNDAQIDALAVAMQFDLSQKRFAPDSVLIHGTIDDFLDQAMPILPHWQRAELLAFADTQGRHVAQVPVLPLAPLFDMFLAAGKTLGIATNDNEAPAIAQLKTAGIHDRFAFVAGCDSGYGAKPASGMQEGFCKVTGIPARETAMVGDSKHDLVSGRNAGMHTIAVLTGVATREYLAPFADVVLNDIGEIPDWIGV